VASFYVVFYFFDNLYSVVLVVVDLVLCYCRLIGYFLPALIFCVLGKRLAGKSVSDMTYLVSSGTVNVELN